MEEHNAVVDAKRNLIEECGKAVDEIKAREPGCWAEWLLPELFALHMELLNAEMWMTSCTGCAASFDGQYAETIRADTAERDLAEARAEIQQLKQQNRDEYTRYHDQIQSLFDERTEVWDKIRADRAALATERATTAQVLADAERFVGQLISSDLVPWGEWGPFGPMKMGAFRMPTHQQAESLLAALRSARGVGEEG